MSRCQFTPQAKHDLESIYDYIAGDDRVAATKLFDLIEAKCQLLRNRPEVGRRREELFPKLRSLPVGNYIIFYRPSEVGIQIIRVLHGARDIESEFK